MLSLTAHCRWCRCVRLGHILSDLRWNSFVCIQGTQKRNSEPFIQYNVHGYMVYEWRSTREAGKRAGLGTAVRHKPFASKHVVCVHTPAQEFLGRVGAIRLNRGGDLDFIILNAYIPAKTNTAAEKRYVSRLWAWIGHLLTKVPSRSIPVVCPDATGRNGRGPSASNIEE